MKRTLADEVNVLLLKHSFTVKSLSRGCFDIAARKDATILLIKILEDANSVSEDYTKAMERISSYIDAVPLIIAQKAGSSMEDGVVYSRFGVYTLSYSTFISALEHSLPFVLSSRAGLTAAVIGEKLRQKREEAGYSLGEISRKVGVSQRMISKYESGMADVSISKAYSLHRIFGSGIFRKIDIFQHGKNLSESKKSAVALKYSSLGFEADDIANVPFDVIAKKDKEIIFTEVGDKANPQLLPLQKLIEANTLVIFSKKKPKKMPALTRKEFLDYDSAGELIKFLKEFE